MSVQFEQSQHPQRTTSSRVRLLTATSRFDGHDVSINILRRLLQDAGAEVIHLGFNRRVKDVVTAAMQEDVDAIAMSSYQGGHMAYFSYLRTELDNAGAKHILIFAGGGGTISTVEAHKLERGGIERIYMPEHGRTMGMNGIINDVVQRIERKYFSRQFNRDADWRTPYRLSQNISCLENSEDGVNSDTDAQSKRTEDKSVPVIGISGPGGAGKSTLINVVLERFLHQFPTIKIALLANDPSRQKSGGALLGDRMRISHLSERVFMRSMATREDNRNISSCLSSTIKLLKQAGFDLVLVETAGSGQSDAAITSLVDISLYVMTNEYGAASQLEKIEMLDQADIIALNKADRIASDDALVEVRRQWKFNHPEVADLTDENMPVVASQASRYRDSGSNKIFSLLCKKLEQIDGNKSRWVTSGLLDKMVDTTRPLIPAARQRYLAEISEMAREIRAQAEKQVALVAAVEHYHASLALLEKDLIPRMFEKFTLHDEKETSDPSYGVLVSKYNETIKQLNDETKTAIKQWRQIKATMSQASDSSLETLSHIPVTEMAVPEYTSVAEWIRYLLKENQPGCYPYTAGLYAQRRRDEDPTRMFAGLSTPEKTNHRFHYLIRGQSSQRLSTAFDPVSLYGEDPDAEPDIKGCIGMSGVSVASLDDMKKLYSGIDLLGEKTSVSMTINGPAAIFLACFFNSAIDQQIEIYLKNQGQWASVEQQIRGMFINVDRPRYQGELPVGHDGLGLGLLGLHGSDVVNAETYARIRDDTLQKIRGTLQADILKEDQAQNECLFPVDFSLKLMADVERYFIKHKIKHYYSVSVSGYHIAEAGANPVTQLAFTLANGFTLLEYYLAQGLAVDDVAGHMSFFFSNAMDPEYAVIGRVARRIWATALKHRYRASQHSQKLKYHIQTSGRSLQAKDIHFNDMRTTLEALYAVMDNCNSLHTNAYDEAVTTPTEESVRRALAIQMIIQREYGLTMSVNPHQGSYHIEKLTDMVEEAVYQEFDRLAQRGGVLGAMEHLYQRRVIQEESLYYEKQMESGRLNIIGVNEFCAGKEEVKLKAQTIIQSSNQDKIQQIKAITSFKKRNHNKAVTALKQLKTALRNGENSFAALMTACRYCSLGQLTQAVAEVGGRYIRNM